MKPLIQFSQDCGASPECISRVNKWLLETFGYEQQRIPFSGHVEKLNLAPKVARKPAIRAKAATSQKKKATNNAGNIGELLDGLSNTFDILRLPAWPDGLAADSRIGLRRMGPFIAQKMGNLADADYFRDEINDPYTHVPADTTYPTMMFVARPMVHQLAMDDIKENENSGGECFLYGIKIDKLPWGVEAIAGDIFYECGKAYKFRGDRGVYWSCFYAGINSTTGAVSIARELLSVPHSVSTKVGRGKYQTKTRHCYTTQKLAIAVAEGQNWGTEKEIRQILVHNLIETLKFWNIKKENWSVAVRKGDQRLTFCIEDGSAKEYFRNRGITALTPAGRRHPIIHICSEHIRHVGDKEITIKEHVRGLEKFEWNGYHCTVTLPKYHNRPSTSPGLAATMQEYMDTPVKHSWIFGSKVGKLIAEFEDAARRV